MTFNLQAGVNFFPVFVGLSLCNFPATSIRDANDFVLLELSCWRVDTILLISIVDTSNS